MKQESVLFAILLLSLLGIFNRAAAQGTAFTYQGELGDSGGPLDGSYDLTFTLYDGPGVLALQIGSPQTLSAVQVNAGLLTVTLDFGGGVFTGPARWLEIAVHPHAGGPTTTLSPRQQLTPAPYAITAGNVTGPIPAGQLSGTLPSGALAGTYSDAVTFNNAGNSFSGNGAGLTGVNAATLGGYSYCSLPCYWNLTGNAGTTPGVNFLGTTDNQALEVKVNSSRALRLEPNANDAPNFIGGSVANSVASGIVGAAIGGGGASGYFEILPELFGGYVNVGANQVQSDFATVAGGGFNTISNNCHFAVISGGVLNTINTNSPEATIGGGFQNTIQTNAAFATICGGVINSAGGIGAFVGGGGYDGINLGGNIANGAASTIGGGVGNAIPSWDHYSFIGGGLFNQISPPQGVYAVNTLGATIGGGGLNTNSGVWATIPGGYQNVAQGSYSFAAGQNAKALHDGTFVWADDSNTTPFSSTAANQFLIRASFTGINRTSPVSGADSFAVRSPVATGYGGMYIDTAGAAGWPFYGYAQAGSYKAWTYLDGSDGNKWKLSYGLTVTPVGDVGIGTTSPGHLLQVGNSGSPAYCDGGAWVNGSDRNVKTGFEPVDAVDILAKVTAMPITSWRYTNDVSTPHVGPMAQDFYAAFGVGADDRHISTVDEGGVALAAIQGLNQKLHEKDTEIRELKARLERLEELVNQKN